MYRDAMVRLTASRLRENIYQILDDVLESGRAVEIERRGKRLRITPVGGVNRLHNLVRRSTIKGTPESIIHCDWSTYWKPKIR